MIEKAAAITSRVAKRNQDWLQLVRPIFYLAAMAREVLASQLIWNCLTAKEGRFQHEREVRCIIMGVRRNFDTYRKMLGSRRYVETPMPLKTPGSITEILVGPLAPPEAEGNITALLTSEGYNDIPVRRSTATLSHGRR